MVKQRYMRDLLHDTLGFGAAKMIRLAIDSSLTMNLI